MSSLEYRYTLAVATRQDFIRGQIHQFWYRRVVLFALCWYSYTHCFKHAVIRFNGIFQVLLALQWQG